MGWLLRRVPRGPQGHPDTGTDGVSEGEVMRVERRLCGASTRVESALRVVGFLPRCLLGILQSDSLPPRASNADAPTDRFEIDLNRPESTLASRSPGRSGSPVTVYPSRAWDEGFVGFRWLATHDSFHRYERTIWSAWISASRVRFRDSPGPAHARSVSWKRTPSSPSLIEAPSPPPWKP